MVEMIVVGREDITGMCKVADIEAVAEKGAGREVKPHINVRFMS